MIEPSHPASNSQMRVLFLLQRIESWSNIRSIWRQMASDPRYRPEIWLLPYDVRKPEESAARTRQDSADLDLEQVPHRIWSTDDALTDGRFDAAVFTNPYDIERPTCLHFDLVARAVPVTAYVPYGFVVGGGHKNRRLQYAQPTQMRATLVFARSWRERAMYRDHCPTGDTHVLVTGLPRLDEMMSSPPAQVDPEFQAAIGGRFAVLWNSHFSMTRTLQGSLDYSTFDRIGSGLLRFATENPDVALIWRPHPHLFPVLLKERLLTASRLENLERELSRAGIILDRRSDHRPAFAASSALLTDAGSFLIEYVLTGKPMAYLHNPDGPGLTGEAQELVSRLDTVSDACGAISFIERVRCGVDAARNARFALRDQLFPMQDGQSASRIAESIAAAVTSARTRHGSRSIDTGSFPALAGLTCDLDALHESRAATASWLRRIRGANRWARDEVVEFVKRRPRLLRMLNAFIS